jgi:nitric oxide reductase NorD protein
MERLRLLGSAIAARPVDVVAGEPGRPGWTDGFTISLDPDASPAEQRQTLAVQASLLAAGSLALEVVTQLTTRRDTARRYLTIEGHRALVTNAPFLPPTTLSLIDRATAGRATSPAESLAIALDRTPLPELPATFGELRPRRVIQAVERAGGVAEALAAPARRPSSRLPDIDGGADDADDEAPDLGQLLASPVGGGGPIGRLLARLLSSARTRSGGGPPGADAATHVGRARARTTRGFVSTTGTAPSLEELAGAPTELTYPEWDVHRRRYRPDWCTVVESDPRPEDLAPMTMPDGAAFRRQLARLGTGLVPCRRRPQGDDLDVDAAIEARVDALAGSPVDERVYVETLRMRRDLSVQILLDVSGSAAEPGPRGRPVHEHQRAVAAALTVALHDLGDRVALHAFNSHGRSSVRVIRLKGFDDRLDGRVVRRIGGLVPGAYTRLGAAIRHGTSLVEEHGGTARRLLVVLSDGFAYDHGYEGRYGEADARRALAEGRSRGIGCLCISVGAGTEAAALRRVFGAAAHASVGTPDELVPLIGPLFRASLCSAETRRRVAQRRGRTRERLETERRPA